MNSVSIIGRVATDIDFRETSGDPVANFRIAVDNFGKDAEADFYTVEVWGRQAEIARDFLGKGRQVGLTGRLKVNKWEKDGEKREQVRINANFLQLIGGPRDDDGAPEAADDDDDIPF